MTADTRTRVDAAAAGIDVTWRDVAGHTREVAPEALRAILAALGDAARDDTPPPLVTADQGQPFTLAGQPARFRLTYEDGEAAGGIAEDAAGARVRLPAIERPGYHRIELNGRETVVAVAPPRCWTVADAAPDRRIWGLALQLYSLRRSGDGGLGDFAALAAFARAAAQAGAAALAISPVHAQFSADAGRFSPYAPSSRAMLNVLHADTGAALGTGSDGVDDALVDWPAAAALRLGAMRDAFTALRANQSPPMREAFDIFRAEHGERLERHARFEALHAAQYGADPARWHWRDWPEPLRDPSSAAVAAFAEENADEIAFHAFLQFMADRGLAVAQRAARDAGMAVGLIADLAVGVDGGGADAWSVPSQMLNGLTIGAPGDLLNPAGQNWGVTTFAPRGLTAHGYGAFLDMLRASLRHAGGVRIDHVMGLARLWVIPDGAGAPDGAYLNFPRDDLLRLVRLESWRHRAIVLGEDLGTLPDGFRETLHAAGLAGMRVLWFEREANGRFIAPADWSADAAAMTSTHDLPTVAGWWHGRDIDWRARLGQRFDEPAARAERAGERDALWDAFRRSGSARGDTPSERDVLPVADAACAHVGAAACALTLLPVEDALALEEQPNLPNTIDQHPNWRRRLPSDAAGLFGDPAVALRLAALARARDA